VQNDSETDVDCGKGSCTSSCCALKCPDGLKCTFATDCVNGVCGVNNVCSSPPCTCQAPTCSDTVKNQNESDVDCGGICGSTCAQGQTCNVPADCSTANCPAGGGVCGSFQCSAPAVMYGGHCYQTFSSTVTFASAEAACVIWGGHLIAINSDAEWLFLKNTIHLTCWEWIGLNDIAVEGTMQWTNGDPVTYMNPAFSNNSATNDCTIQRDTSAQKGDWQMVSCDTLHCYVCER
jgi:hypothetical protein